MISCTKQPEQKSAGINSTKPKVSLRAQADTSQAQGDQTRWKEVQDSLRTQLLNSMTNENLKSGILAEPYIRGLVTEVNGTYQINLSFDLHGFDCSAPDCYTTDLTFTIPATIPLSFPKTIQYKILEHGCVNKTTDTGTFELKEQTAEYVNYYSETERSNLLLFREDERKEFIYYFPDAEPDSIKAELVSQMLKRYNEEDPEAIAPYRITTMLAREYERFLND